MKLEIRSARHTDFGEITAIYAHAVATDTASFEELPPDRIEMTRRFETLRAAGYPYIVAQCSDGAVAGYAYASSYRTRPAYRFAVEDSVYVDGNFQGRGIARTLLEALIARCVAAGFRQMIAIISDSDSQTQSVRLHTRCGFDEIGRMPAVGYKNGAWLDTIVMQRALGEGASGPPRLV